MRNPNNPLSILKGPGSRLPARVEALRAQLGISGPDADEALRSLLLAVGQAAAGVHGMRREPWRQTYRECLVCPSGHLLYLARWPIESVESIEIGGRPVDPDSFLVAGPRRDYLYRSSGWPGLVESITYTAGWLMPEQVSAWAAGAEVKAGAWARPSDPSNLLLFEAAGPGQTGAEEPAWPEEAGQEVEDGTVTWTGKPATEQPEDATQVALLTAAQWHGGGLDLPLGVVSESDEAGTTRYSERPLPGPLPPVAAAVWRSYR